MDAIWIRMDQLERIVMAQGREIECLRRIIEHQMDPTNYHNERHTIGHQISLDQQHGYKDSNRNSFHMNSFVHPASAVPPFVRWLPEPINRDQSNSFQRQTEDHWSSEPDTHLSARLESQGIDFDETSLQKKPKGLNLVEVLTCFCPCFSMC